MGDSTSCLLRLHGFSYASAIPNESKQGNPMHALGESISFGRFMTESTSTWEKWSSSPHKKHVEEAERFAQPGSVAQKKAFFEAHYKRIAAQKAEAHDKAKTDSENHDGSESVPLPDVAEEIEGVKEDKLFSRGENAIITELEGPGESRISVTGSEITGTPQMEMPLLKHNNSVATNDASSAESKQKPDKFSLKSSIRRKTWNVVPCASASRPLTSSPYLKKENSTAGTQRSKRKSSNVMMDSTDKRGTSSKSLRDLINLILSREPDKELVFAAKKKGSSTHMRTTKGVSEITAATPLSENRRLKTPIDPSAARGSKTSAPRWHILSSVSSKSMTAYRNKLQSPCLSTPFTLRTEERAAKRKQKLEEKIDVNEAQKARQQKNVKEKSGKEHRRLSCTFCFKACPLPELYKEREPSVKKNSVPQPQTKVVLGKSNSNKKQGTTSSMPAPPLPPKTSRSLMKKKITNGSKVVTPLLRVPPPENKSPNLQPCR